MTFRGERFLSRLKIRFPTVYHSSVTKDAGASEEKPVPAVWNMKKNLEIGLTLTESYIIGREHAARSVGSGEVEVLSTPAMVAFMEKTASRCVKSKLPENSITVGTRIDIRHLSPTPIGEKIKVKAELVKIDNRKLVFRVKAEWHNEVIGRGQHERFIVNKERFLERLEARSSRRLTI